MSLETEMGTSSGHTHLLIKYYGLDYTPHGTVVRAVILIQSQLQSVLSGEPWEGYQPLSYIGMPVR